MVSVLSGPSFKGMRSKYQSARPLLQQEQSARSFLLKDLQVGTCEDMADCTTLALYVAKYACGVGAVGKNCSHDGPFRLAHPPKACGPTFSRRARSCWKFWSTTDSGLVGTCGDMADCATRWLSVLPRMCVSRGQVGQTRPGLRLVLMPLALG